MARNNFGDYRYDDLTRKRIQASYIELENYSAVARIFGCDVETVRTIVREDRENITKLLDEKKSQNTQSVLDFMEEQAELKKTILYDALNRIEEKLKEDSITASDLTRIYGVLMDKELINYANKKNTNNSVNKITIVNSLPTGENDDN